MDQVEVILKKRKQQRKHQALAFLKEIELKKTEAMAQQLLNQNMHARQSQGTFEEQISKTRKQLMGTSTLQEIMNRQTERNQSDLSSSDDEDLRPKTGTEKVLQKLNGKKDPLFFEFFSIYTAQSIKQ